MAHLSILVIDIGFCPFWYGDSDVVYPLIVVFMKLDVRFLVCDMVFGAFLV